MTDTATLEAALRNPATSRRIEREEIGIEGRRLYYGAELHQLIPLAEHENPWVLITTEEGERELEAYDSLRMAEVDYARAVDRLRADWTKYYSDDDEEDED